MQNHHKSVLIRLFDNPMDRVIQGWLDDVPNRQNGGKSLIIKTVLFEYAQEMGYHSPGSRHEPTKKVSEISSARRRAEREALEEKLEAEKNETKAPERLLFSKRRRNKFWAKKKHYTT